MRKKFGLIILTLVCLIVTVIMVVVVVIPHPTEVTSYLALSFALVLDAIWLYAVITFRQCKGPKTISKRMVCWLLVVLYCCFIASGFLTDGYISTSDIFMLTFDCIFAAMGLAAAVALIIMFIQRLLIKHCLKYGEEAVAEFVCMGDSTWFKFSNHSVLACSVVFKYFAKGQEITAKSKRVFSEQEVNLLQTMKTFKIKFDKRTAVISETLNTDSPDKKQNDW